MPVDQTGRCLAEVFGLTPEPELFRYEIRVGERARELARRYLQTICQCEPDGTGRFPAVLIHYEGNTSNERKNLSHNLVREVCEVVLRSGTVPVILDWDRRSPLVDGEKIYNPARARAVARYGYR